MSQSENIARARRALEGAAQLLTSVGAGTPDSLIKAQELVQAADEEIRQAMMAIGGVTVDIFADLKGPPAPPVDGPHFWEKGRQFPHSYDEDGTSDCAHGCGCWTGATNSGGPVGVNPFGECPNHPDRAKAA